MAASEVADSFNKFQEALFNRIIDFLKEQKKLKGDTTTDLVSKFFKSSHAFNLTSETKDKSNGKAPKDSTTGKGKPRKLPDDEKRCMACKANSKDRCPTARFTKESWTKKDGTVIEANNSLCYAHNKAEKVTLFTEAETEEEDEDEAEVEAEDKEAEQPKEDDDDPKCVFKATRSSKTGLQKGEQCPNEPIKNSKFCKQHQNQEIKQTKAKQLAEKNLETKEKKAAEEAEVEPEVEDTEENETEFDHTIEHTIDGEKQTFYVKVDDDGEKFLYEKTAESTYTRVGCIENEKVKLYTQEELDEME